MRVEKKTKHLHIEFIVNSHNSVMLLHSFTVDEVLRMPLWTVLTKFLVLPGHLGINGTSECEKLHNKTHIVQNCLAWYCRSNAIATAFCGNQYFL